MASTGVEESSEVKGKQVMVAVDESEESGYALQWALNNLIQPHDKVHLVHAQPPPRIYPGPAGPGMFMSSTGYYVSPDILTSLQKHEEAVSRGVLKKAKAVCDEAKVACETEVAPGEPREALCEAVDVLQPSMLVMGSHGYGAIKRAFLGSVSDYCTHYAKCPVVVVRRPIT